MLAGRRLRGRRERGDAIGRVFFAATFKYLFGGKMPMPPLLEGYAYVKPQCEFVAWFTKLLEGAVK